MQICTKKERLHVLLSLLERDAPKSTIIFVAEQVQVYIHEVLLVTCHVLYKISIVYSSIISVSTIVVCALTDS